MSMSRKYSAVNSEEMDRRLAECLQQEEYEQERLRIQRQQQRRPTPPTPPPSTIIVQPSPQAICHPHHHYSHHCYCRPFGGHSCSFHRHACCSTSMTSSSVMECFRCHRSMMVHSNFLSFKCPHCGQLYQKTTAP
jgi:hypothetical protein